MSKACKTWKPGNWNSWSGAKRVSTKEREELICDLLEDLVGKDVDATIMTGDTLLCAVKYADGTVEVVDCKVRRIRYYHEVEEAANGG